MTKPNQLFSTTTSFTIRQLSSILSYSGLVRLLDASRNNSKSGTDQLSAMASSSLKPTLPKSAILVLKTPFNPAFPSNWQLLHLPSLTPRATLPEYTPSKYFEYALLHKFDFIVDVEAAELYPDTVDVIYSYRRLPYKYSQFVHKTGAAFCSSHWGL